MQDLGMQAETNQMVTVVKNTSMVGTSKDRDKENREMKEFEAFQRYKAMKNRCEEKERTKRKKCEKKNGTMSRCGQISLVTHPKNPIGIKIKTEGKAIGEISKFHEKQNRHMSITMPSQD